MTQAYAIVALVAYLLGSVPFGYILVKLFLKQDIRQTGSGNIGATNVARSGKKGLAIATLLLDAAKGFVAVGSSGLLLWEIFSRYKGAQFASQKQPTTYPVPIPQELLIAAAVAALFAVIGHCFPVWLKFKGGKGVATGVGAFAALAPKGVLVACVAFILIVAVSRYVSLGSILAAAIFPVAAYFLEPEMRTLPVMTMTVATSALIISKHHQNISRLIAGNENKFGSKPAPKDPTEAEQA